MPHRPSFKPSVEELGIRILPSTTSLTTPLDTTADWGDAPTPDGVAETITLPVGGFNAGPAISPDGSRFAVGGRDGNLRLFDAPSGQQLFDLPGHTHMIMGVTFSPDGSTLATVGYDRTVRFWDAQTGALKQTVGLGGLGLNGRFLPNGSFGVTSYGEGILEINPATGASRLLIDKSAGDPDTFLLRSDGGIVVLIGPDIRIYDVSGSSLIRSFRVDATPYCQAIDPATNMLAVGDGGGTVSLWNTENGQKLGSVSAGSGAVFSLEFGADGTLTAGNAGGAVTVFDMRDLKNGSVPSGALKTATLGRRVMGIGTCGWSTIAMTSLGSTDTPRLFLLRSPLPPPPPPAQIEPLATMSAEPQSSVIPAPSETEDATEAIAAVFAQEYRTSLEQPLESLDTTTFAEVSAAVFEAQALETQEAVGDPTMYVWLEPSGPDTKIFVRFRSPFDATYAEVLRSFSGRQALRSELIEHPGGMRDETVMMLVNGQLYDTAIIPIRLRSGTDGTVLQTIYGFWDQGNRRMKLLTEQEGFEMQTAEQRTERIEPAMQVETEGRLVFVRFQSPGSRTALDIARAGELDMLGRAAYHETCAANGVQEGLAQLAVPENAPTDAPLVLRLWDKPMGNILSEVTLEYDGMNVRVVAGTKPVGSGPIPRAELLQSITQWNESIRAARGTDLYERSRFFLSGSMLETRLRAAFPNEFPEDLGAVVDRMHQEGPTYPAGFYEQQMLEAQQVRRAEYAGVLNNYAARMAELLLQGIDFWVRIRNGEAERPLDEALHAKLASIDFGPIDVLGLTRPTVASIVAEANRLCAQYDSVLRQAQLDSQLLEQSTSYETEAPTAETSPSISPEAHAHTLNIILNTDGTLSKADRVYNYTRLYPESRAIAQTLAPVEVWTEIVARENRTLIATAGILDNLEIIGINEAPNSKNTMIVVVYGSNQFPGDPSANFETLMLYLNRKYDVVRAFTPGYNPREGLSTFIDGPNPSMTQPEIQNLIAFEFAQNSNLKNVVLVGYSWGGGLVYDLSAWLPTELPEVKLVASVYVDAVNDDLSAGAENRMPIGTQSMLNIYQSQTALFQDSFLLLNGGPVENTSSIKDFIEIDVDQNENTYSHYTIDSIAVWHILDFIQQRVTISAN